LSGVISDSRIAHNYWTVDNDTVWTVVEEHAAQLHQALAEEIDTARSVLQAADEQNP
jgi:uncharacterized protein with HEPN domain